MSQPGSRTPHRDAIYGFRAPETTPQPSSSFDEATIMRGAGYYDTFANYRKQVLKTPTPEPASTQEATEADTDADAALTLLKALALILGVDEEPKATPKPDPRQIMDVIHLPLAAVDYLPETGQYKAIAYTATVTPHRQGISLGVFQTYREARERAAAYARTQQQVLTDSPAFAQTQQRFAAPSV